MGIVIKLFFDKEQNDLNVVLLKNAEKRNILKEAEYDVVADLKVSLNDLCDGMIVDECEAEEALSNVAGFIVDGHLSDDSNQSCVTIPLNSSACVTEAENSDSEFVAASNRLTHGEYIITEPRRYSGSNDVPRNSSDLLDNHSVDHDSNRNLNTCASRNQQVDSDSPDSDVESYRRKPRRSARNIKKRKKTNDQNVVMDSDIDSSSSDSDSDSDSDSEPMINFENLHKRLRRSPRKTQKAETTNDLNVITGSVKPNKCRKRSATSMELSDAQKENLLPNENTRTSICTSFDIEEEIMKETMPRQVLSSSNPILNSGVSKSYNSREEGKGVNDYERSFMNSIKANKRSPKKKNACKHTEFNCSFCGRQFLKAPMLIEHERTHTGEKPFSCDKCNYKCASKPNLMRHKRTHSKDRPYTCAICGHRTKLKITLQQHIETHADIRRFKCRYCNYRAVQQNNVRSHELMHKGEKSFVCGTCNYSCNTKGDLVKHCRTHLKPQVIQCQHCRYKCMDKGTMTKHIWQYCQEFQEDLQNHE